MKTSPLDLLRKLATRLSTKAARAESTERGAQSSLNEGGESDDDRERGEPGVAVNGTQQHDTQQYDQALFGTPAADEELHDYSTWNDTRTVVGKQDVPESIDHFEIRRVLGKGGFGSVFLAYDTRLDRMVALKLLDRLEKSAARRMLEHETKAASKLKHPNLVTVFQSGEHERGYYIVFEYVPGTEPENANTLRELFANKRRIQPKQAVHFVRQVTEALAYAHQANVVHRDIKPENILVDFKGTAYLADFGCARQSKRHIEGIDSLVGTLPYMSLEQIDGQWNSQTDIWSIGVVLYEMLSGKRPFEFAEKIQSRSAAEAAFSYAVAVLEVQQLPPIAGVDADLLAICQKCLCSQADDRYQSAADVAADLARWQRHEPVSCRPVSIFERARRWARRNPVIAAQLATIAALLVGGVLVSTFLATKMWQARRQYVYEQIRQFDQLDAETFRAAVANLQNEPFRNMAITTLVQQWQAKSDSIEAEQDPSQRNRLAAALLAFDRTKNGEKPASLLVQQATDELLKRMLTTNNPDEFRFLRQYVVSNEQRSSKHDRQRIETLWQIAKQANSDQQLNALLALSEYDPGSANWNKTLEVALAEGILGQETTNVVGWAQASDRVANRLLPLLKREIDSPNPQRRARAEIAYAALASTPVEIAKRIVSTSSSEVAHELLMQLKARNLTDEQRQAVSNEFQDRGKEREPHELANQSTAQLYLDGPIVGGKLSIFDATAPIDARLMFELNAARSGLPLRTMSDWLHRLTSGTDTVGAAQTALLALGHWNVNNTSESVRQLIFDQVLAVYRDNPHARIHAAADRVLRQWNVKVPTVDRANHGDVEDSWRVNSLGQLLVRTRLPSGIACEVTAYEVTLGDYANYVRSRAEYYTGDKRVVSWIRKPIVEHFNNYPRDTEHETAFDEDNIPAEHQVLPIRNVSALQAMAYCVWVSEQTEIPADQFCFEVESQGDDSLLDAIERNLAGKSSSVVTGCDREANGYRLPFQDEWLQLTASLPTIATLRGDIGWYRENSRGHIWPVGKTRPNERGIFDLRGNVAEWYLRLQSNQDGSGRAEMGTMGASFDSDLADEQRTVDGLQVIAGDPMIGYRLIRVLE